MSLLSCCYQRSFDCFVANCTAADSVASPSNFESVIRLTLRLECVVRLTLQVECVVRLTPWLAFAWRKQYWKLCDITSKRYVSWSG